MSKKGDKKSFLNKLFGNSKPNKKTTNDEQEYPDNRTVRFGQNQHHRNHTFAVDDEDLRDETGHYKATAAYHTSAHTKASRGPRSYAGKSNKTVQHNYSSDSDTNPNNRSFQSAYNAGDIAKRNFRRSSKRSKKRPVFENFDEQSSSNTSYTVLQNLDTNTQMNSRLGSKERNEYWQRPVRQQPDENWIKVELLERKYHESQEKISECVNRYRREKQKSTYLQEQLNDLMNLRREDAKMIHEQQKQIQELQKEIERHRNGNFMQPNLFNQSLSFQQHQFHQRNSATPSSHIFPAYQNQPAPHLNEMSNNMMPTRTVSEVDTESHFAIKDFRSGHKHFDEGAPEQMISESSIALSTDREEREIPRSSNDNSFSTLSNTVVNANLMPVRDEGYSTTDTIGLANKHLNRRSKHLANAVPHKIRRTNSWN